jgi:MraZ protein
MFFGKYRHTIDSKSRLTIPAKHRNELASGVVIAPGIDRCLTIYPMARWQHISDSIEQLPPMTDEDVREFLLFLFGESSDEIPDKQGRVIISNDLREFANLGDEVIVAGVRDHLEVWNPETYAEKRAKIQKDPNALAQKLGRFGIL